MKYPTISKTYEIDKRAEKLFEFMIKDSWPIREQRPDIHIDYIIEAESGGEPTGLKVAIQLKGVSRNRDWKPKIAVKSKHLEYYLTKVRMPVFLVLVNVATKEVYWEFLQKHLVETGGGQILRRQKSLTIKPPKENALTDFAKFEAAVRSADVFVRNLWPGSTKAAVENRAKELASKDDRFTVKVDLVDGKEHITFEPKSNVKFSFGFAQTEDHSTLEKIRRMLDYGEEVELPEGAIQFQGSPIFDELNEEGKKGVINARWGVEREVQVCLRNPSDGSFVPVFFPGMARAGLKGVMIEAGGENSAMGISLRIGVGRNGMTKPFDLTLEFNPHVWMSRKLAQLSQFERIHALALAIKSNHEILCEVTLDGNLVLSAKMSQKTHAIPTEMTDLLDVLADSREIARIHSLDPVLASSFVRLKRQLNLAVCIKQLLKGDVVEFNGDGAKITGLFSPRSEIQLSEHSKALPLETIIAFWDFDFFDQKLRLGPIKLRLTEAMISSLENELEGKREIQWTGSPKSTLQLSLAPMPKEDLARSDERRPV